MERVTQISKGIFTDVSAKQQPENSYRFALNTVQETEEGDFYSLSNESSNVAYTSLPKDSIIAGKVYAGNGETILCLADKHNLHSQIGIMDAKGNYTTYYNDKGSQSKIKFSKENKVQLVYRLRRGCEKTIYFVQNGNPPRYFNFNKIEDFLKDGKVDVEKLKLFKTHNDVPSFNDIKIVNGGILPSGSYNFAVQYLDADFNPTEWISTTDTVNIYTDSVEGKEYSEIRGSSGKKTDYQDFGTSGKAITFNLNNLNKSFPFYRIAVIEAVSGTGEVTRVIYSTEQSVYNTTFTYTGETEGFTKGTTTEIAAFNLILDNVQHIEQIENKLILSNVEGKKINYCDLQKYASKISSSLSLKKINLENINLINNPKRGELHNESVGYMPGEIYSFGIVYVFKDGTQSPVYHIPGKSETSDTTMKGDNILENSRYIDNSSCDEGPGYWGVDVEGNLLKNQLVRHHRFPSRGEVGEPLFEKSFFKAIDENPIEEQPGVVMIDITGVIPTEDIREKIYYRVPFNKDGQDPYYLHGEINVADYKSKEVEGVNPDYKRVILGTFPQSNITKSFKYFPQEKNENSQFEDFTTLDYEVTVKSGINPSISQDVKYNTNIFGISFDNIDRPLPSDTFGEEVVGYFIVRNERKENNKTILDSGVLTPLLEEKNKVGDTKFVSHGHLSPESNRLKEDTFALIHPEHKFNGFEYKNTTEYVKEGEFTITQPKNYNGLITQDVLPGTSYDGESHKRRERDSDGFTLHNRIRNSNLSYKSTPPTVLAQEEEINETFYLDTLYSKTVTDSEGNRKSIYNLSADNKIGILQLNKKLPKSDFVKKFPYVVMKRKLSDPYANFRNSAFYKEHNNLKMFTKDTESSEAIFNGDSYISSMKYTSSLFYSIVMRKRSTKSGLFNFILGVLSIVGGILVTGLTFGAATALGIAMVSFGIAQTAAGLKKEQLAKVYGDLYDQGLKDTVEDNHTVEVFKNGNQISDDEIQWFQDTLSDLWFESNVNMSWRMGATIGIPDFMNSPSGYDTNTFSNYALEKVTGLDSEADGGRTYQGFAKAEIYEINKDYSRRDREKRYYSLGIEYDCCSDCIEKFPHRVHYSMQSFQEELTDNFRVFLPNDYRDIEGETGEITNIFRIQNNLYIHTEEALWHMPQNFQERVTGDIISFIGTGEYFNIPPRKIVDDQNGHSAGTKHKWGMIKTPHGVFFPSEDEGAIYKFTGENVSPISSEGTFNWFKNNMKILSEDPTSGFISAYDSRKERVLFTKRDKISNSLDNSWTISYSLKTNSWVSWHSYTPDFYITVPNSLYSFINGQQSIWKHNIKGSFQNFYGKRKPFIIEYVSLSNSMQTKVYDYITLLTEAKKYDKLSDQYFEKRFITFNKATLYNDRQCTGEMNLIVKDTQEFPENYMGQQIVGQFDNNVIIDKDEKNWHLNDIRDIRVDYESPIWNSSLPSLQKEYYIDKVLNSSSIDINKDWRELESFRGKYLVIRLQFDTFEDIKLIFNASVENENITAR
jgi:hypothetical protein